MSFPRSSYSVHAASLVLLGIAAVVLCGIKAPGGQKTTDTPTFYRDVLPILQKRCQSCHRRGEIAPMPFVTYEQTRPWADAIAEAVKSKKMPPWFADPRFGRFANDPSLTLPEIGVLSQWANNGATAGKSHDAPPPPHWAKGWNIVQPDDIVQMPKPVAIPARADVEYTYEIVPTGFREDKWIQMSEVRPSSRAHVHHAVVYIRPPDSKWLRHAPVGVPFTASSLTDPQDRRDAHVTDSDLLLVYAPGSSPDEWPDGMAKFMHLRGKRFEYDIVHPDGRVETLLRVNYDFYWQLSYRLAEARQLKAGTKLLAVAWYDNSRHNPHNPDPSSPVQWGGQTYNEMMVGFFDVAVPANVDKWHFFIRNTEH